MLAEVTKWKDNLRTKAHPLRNILQHKAAKASQRVCIRTLLRPFQSGLAAIISSLHTCRFEGVRLPRRSPDRIMPPPRRQDNLSPSSPILHRRRMKPLRYHLRLNLCSRHRGIMHPTKSEVEQAGWSPKPSLP